MTNIQHDQLLVPVAGGTGYMTYPILQLLGTNTRTEISNSGFGLAPLHYITQRGPYQDGETVTDMRFDTRTVQIVVSGVFQSRTEKNDARATLLDLIRPNRSFSSGVTRPMIYRRRLPAGAWERGSDLVTQNTSSVVTSHYGKFITNGLSKGMNFTIVNGADAGSYGIVDVRSDYSLVLDTAMGANDANVGWRYQRGYTNLDLYCLLEAGPVFDEGPGPELYHPFGYKEVLRLVAHDPFWYGGPMTGQSQVWDIGSIGDLVFDGYGAWFGVGIAGSVGTGGGGGSGRWLFHEGDFAGVGETVNLVYWGTAVAKPIITIEGPATNVIVTNTTAGLSITLRYRIPLGTTVTIDTLALTVQDQIETNLLSYMSGDLATFGIFPAPQAANRRNQIFISFDDGIVPDSRATLSWRNRYVGI